MGDDNELCLAGDAAHILGEPGDVGIVQGRLDLVHDAKRRGMHLQNGEIQGNGHKGLLAAGEERDGLEALARGLDLDLDAAAQNVAFILQLQRGLAAAEELPEGLLETLVEQPELLGEDVGHLPGDLLDDPLQVRLGLLHVVPLARQIGITGVDPLELLDGADVGRAQGVDLLFQLADAAGGLCHALQLDALGLGVGVAELVMLPQPVQDLLFLQGGGGDLLLQTGGSPLQVQQVLVALLALLVAGGTLGLQGDLLLVQLRQAVPQGLPLPAQLVGGIFAAGDLRLGLGDGVPVLLYQVLLVLPAAGELLPQVLQVLEPSGGGVPLRGQSCQAGLFLSDVLGQRAAALQQLRLARQLFLRLGPVLFRQGLLAFHLRLGGGGAGGVVLQPSLQGRQLSGQVLLVLPQSAKQQGKVVFRTLQPQHLVLGLTALALGHLQLILGGGKLALELALLFLGSSELFPQALYLLFQTLQFIGPAQHAGAAADAAAGHGAAPVEKLAVQGHDTEAAGVFPGHGDAAVHVLHHHGTSQQVFHNILILWPIGHQSGGDAHEASLLLHPRLPQLSAADGAQGQEGGPAAVPLFQIENGALGVLLPVHHDILQRAAQSDLQGHGAALVGLNEPRHRAVDAPKGPAGLHHQPDSLVEALILLLHLCQKADPVVHGAGVHGQAHLLLPGSSGLALALFQTHGVAGDDVGGGLGLLLCVLQGPPVGLGLGLLLLELRVGVLLLLEHRAPALLDLPPLRLQGGELRPAIRSGGHGHGLLAPQGLCLGLSPAGLLRGLPGPGQQRLQLPVQGLDLLVDLPDAGALLIDLLLQSAGPVGLLAQLFFHSLDVLLLVCDVGFQHRHAGLLVPDPAFQLRGLAPDRLGFHVLFPHPLAVALRLGVERVQLRPGLVPLLTCGAEIALQLPGLLLEGLQILQPHGDLQKAHLVPEDQIPLGLLRLVPQRLHLQLQLGDLVIDADQVLLRPLQLPLGLLLAVAELGDAGGLLEDLPALAALDRQDLVDLALADDGVALLAHAGV